MSNPKYWGNALIVATACGAVALAVVTLISLDPADADIKYDWISANAALTSDAYSGVLDLARELDVSILVHAAPGASEPGAHPRTPGAILVSIPLLAFSFDQLFAVSTFLTVASGALIMAPLFRRASKTDRAALVLLSLVAAPSFVALRFAGQAAVVAALTIFGWAMTSRKKGILGGILIGLAGVLKVFPLLLVIPLLLRRRYVPAAVTFFTVLLLNLGGLALPGVGFEGALSVLTEASVTWTGLLANGSLVKAAVEAGLHHGVAQIVVLVVLGALSGVLVKVHRSRALADPLPWIVTSLLAIPLSWISYDVILLPALGSLLLSDDKRARILGMAGWALWIAPTLAYAFVIVESGVVSLAVRMFLLVAWWMSLLTWKSRGLSSTWVDGVSGPPERVETPGALATGSIQP
ncbi:MAG TPA: glycosyltransferase 87 family protein [Acidimicrobiia bacterium]|nr:glycosyltransferase 87 family protein [Acidimicrobiia bacterium]